MLAFQGLKKELLTNELVRHLVEQQEVDWWLAKHIGLENPLFHEVTLRYNQALQEVSNTQIETEEIRLRKSWLYFYFAGTVRDAFKDKIFKIEALFFVCQRTEDKGYIKLTVMDAENQPIVLYDYDQIDLESFAKE